MSRSLTWRRQQLTSPSGSKLRPPAQRISAAARQTRVDVAIVVCSELQRRLESNFRTGKPILRQPSGAAPAYRQIHGSFQTTVGTKGRWRFKADSPSTRDIASSSAGPCSTQILTVGGCVAPWDLRISQSYVGHPTVLSEGSLLPKPDT